MFITLTILHQYDLNKKFHHTNPIQSEKIRINIKHIRNYSRPYDRNADGKTFIKFISGDGFTDIKETPEQIDALISNLTK